MFKNIKVKVKGGGSRLQRVKVLASGKYRFVKNLSRSRHASVKTVKTKSRSMRMARRRIRSRVGRSRGSLKIPVAPIIGVLGASNSYGAWNSFRSGQFYDGIEKVGAGLTGYSITSHNWESSRLYQGAVPILLGVGAHMLASKLGINRALGKARVPLFRI